MAQRTHKWIHDQINAFLDWRQKKYWNGDDRWKRNMALDRGEHWEVHGLPRMPTGKDGKPLDDYSPDLITVNLVGSYVRLLASHLTFRQLKAFVRPTQPEHVVGAELMTKAVQYEWRRGNFEQGYHEAIMDAIVIGDGWYRTEWKTLLDRDSKNKILETRDILEDAPCGSRKSPFMILWDYTSPTKRIDGASWAAELSYVTKQFVQENENYNNESLRRAMRKGDQEAQPQLLKDQRNRSDYDLGELYADGDWCVRVEVWDKVERNRRIYLVGMEEPVHEDVPVEWDRNQQYGGYNLEYPWLNLRLIDLINEQYGLGLPVWIDELQMEYNRSRTMMFDRRKREVGGQVQCSEGTSDDEINRYLKGEKVIRHRAGDAQGIRPIITAAIPADEYRILAGIQQDMERITRLNEILFGMSAGNRTSATEFQGRTQFSLSGIQTFVTKVDGFARQIVRHLLKHIQYGYDRPRMAQLAGPLAEYWGKVIDMKKDVIDMGDGSVYVRYSREHIQGEFDVEIETTSAPALDPVTEYQQLKEYVLTCAQMGQLAAGTGVDLTNLGGVDVYQGLRMLGQALNRKDIARILPGAVVVNPPIPQVLSQQLSGQAGQSLQQTNSSNFSESKGKLFGERGEDGSA